MVVIMDKGQVKWVGSPTDCSSSTYAAFVGQEKLKTSSKTKAQVKSGMFGMLGCHVQMTQCLINVW